MNMWASSSPLELTNKRHTTFRGREMSVHVTFTTQTAYETKQEDQLPLRNRALAMYFVATQLLSISVTEPA